MTTDQWTLTFGGLVDFGRVTLRGPAGETYALGRVGGAWRDVAKGLAILAGSWVGGCLAVLFISSVIPVVAPYLLVAVIFAPVLYLIFTYVGPSHQIANADGTHRGLCAGTGLFGFGTELQLNIDGRRSHWQLHPDQAIATPGPGEIRISDVSTILGNIADEVLGGFLVPRRLRALDFAAGPRALATARPDYPLEGPRYVLEFAADASAEDRLIVALSCYFARARANAQNREHVGPGAREIF